MKKKEKQHEHFLRRHTKPEDISKLSERLAPPEETGANQEAGHDSFNNDDTISIDTGKLKLPKGFVEDQQEKRGVFGLEPVIIVIMALMLAFIAFIAYLIYLSPSK